MARCLLDLATSRTNSGEAPGIHDDGAIQSAAEVVLTVISRRFRWAWSAKQLMDVGAELLHEALGG